MKTNILLEEEVVIDPSSTFNNVNIEILSKIAKIVIFGSADNILEIGSILCGGDTLKWIREQIKIGNNVSIAQSVNMTD
jgi:hypothetical protein